MNPVLAKRLRTEIDDQLDLLEEIVLAHDLHEEEEDFMRAHGEADMIDEIKGNLIKLHAAYVQNEAQPSLQEVLTSESL